MTYLKAPRNTFKRESFIAFRNILKRFVAGFADICAPIDDKIQKDESLNFVLTEMKTKEIKILLQNFVSSLYQPCNIAQGRFNLNTDSCEVRVELVILQEQRGKTPKPTGY